MTDKTPNDVIDIDAILAKREEEVGSRDRFPFAFNGETWWCVDPLLADDDWREGLEDLRAGDDDEYGEKASDTVAIAQHYLGDVEGGQYEGQWDLFREAGGHSGVIIQVLGIYADKQSEAEERGKGTRSGSYSNRRQRRQRRR